MTPEELRTAVAHGMRLAYCAPGRPAVAWDELPDEARAEYLELADAALEPWVVARVAEARADGMRCMALQFVLFQNPGMSDAEAAAAVEAAILAAIPAKEPT